VPSLESSASNGERGHVEWGGWGDSGCSGRATRGSRVGFWGRFRLTLGAGESIIKMLFHLAPAFPPTTSSKSRGTFHRRLFSLLCDLNPPNAALKIAKMQSEFHLTTNTTTCMISTQWNGASQIINSQSAMVNRQGV